jgi:hypothetical protein
MDSDANHTVRYILLTGVNEVRRVVVQTKPFSFALGFVVGAHVKYWVYKYRRPPLEGAGLGIGGVVFSPCPALSRRIKYNNARPLLVVVVVLGFRSFSKGCRK